MANHKTGRHHLGPGAPLRASQRRQQGRTMPTPMLRAGAPVNFRGQPATFLEHGGGNHAVILLNDRRWSVPMGELS